MNLDPRTLALIRQRLNEAERNLQYIQHILEETSEGRVSSLPTETEIPETQDRARVVEGVFDGKNMQGNDGEEYPVPPNYASKSKLVEGDVMKLTIGTDGSFVYKQIRPIERVRLIGTAVVDEQGKFGIKVENKVYGVLLASVTFYEIEEGDQVAIFVPTNSEAEWGAVDNVVQRVRDTK